MPQIKIEIRLTPNEIKEMLPKSLQGLWDKIVINMVELGHSNNEANAIVAQMFLTWLKQRDKK
jgi:hypothetical protein